MVPGAGGVGTGGSSAGVGGDSSGGTGTGGEGSAPTPETCTDECALTDEAVCADATTRQSCQMNSAGCLRWHMEVCSSCNDATNCVPVTNIQWGEQGDHASDVAIAADGSLFATTSTTATLGFTYSGPAQWRDIVLLKWAQDGTPIWAAKFGTKTQELARSLALGLSGEIYVGGQTTAPLGEDPYMGKTDLAIARVSAEGEVEWVHTWGSAGTDDMKAMAISPTTQSVAVLGHTKAALDGQIPIGDVDIFVTDWGFDEQKGATHVYGTEAFDFPNALAIDDAGNRYIVGQTEGQFEGETASGGIDAFLLSVDSNGAQRWVRQIGTTSNENLHGVAMAEGQVLVVGSSSGDLDANDDVTVEEGSYAPFVASYTSDGTLNWLRQFSDDVGATAFQISVAPDGAIYVLVESSGNLPNRPNPGVSATALYLTRWTTTGEFEWLLGWGTDSVTRSSALAAGSSGQLLVGGSTQGTFPGFETTSPSGGAFVSLLQLD